YFDDGAAGHDAAAIVDEDFAEQIARDVERRAIIESTRKLHRCRRRATARSAARATSASLSVASDSANGSAAGLFARPKTSATSARIFASGSCTWRVSAAGRFAAISTRYCLAWSCSLGRASASAIESIGASVSIVVAKVLASIRVSLRSPFNAVSTSLSV